MGSTKFKLGALFQLKDERNSNGFYTLEDVRGISIQKTFIKTKANMESVSLAPYIVVKPDYFAYVTVTSRNGGKITIAHNNTEKTFIVSSSYVVFDILRKDLLDSKYLFMLFNRPEFDRYARFNSWGSARETFNWEEMCNIEIELPDLPTQRKFVAIYNALLANQQSYERGLEDLKLVCDGYVEDLRRKMPCEKIGRYLGLVEERNNGLRLGIGAVRGISIEKELIETKADMKDVDLSSYFVIEPNDFAYVPVTSRNGGKISIALNDSENLYICSSAYVVFRSIDTQKLLPAYLMLFFLRAEFDRYARFNSWGSARESFAWDDMKDVEIPIPDISVQKAIAEIYTVYTMCKGINEKLKEQIRDICPILIKGSLEEGR